MREQYLLYFSQPLASSCNSVFLVSGEGQNDDDDDDGSDDDDDQETWQSALLFPPTQVQWQTGGH